MDKKSIDEINDIISNIDDPEIDNKTQTIRLHESDPLFSLKIKLSEFFKNRLDKIIEEDSFKNKVKEAILEKINNNEFSASQLVSLYNTISNTSNNSIDAVLDIFKPSKEGAISPILKDRDKAMDEDTPYEDIEPDKAEALNKLTELVQSMYHKINNK